jgi:dipeptidyl aminopeptidase/acylaminoacyl peptidase
MPEGLGAFNVLQGRGVPSRLLYFPDENHWVINEENSRVWHTVVINWMNRWVGYSPYADEEKVVGPSVGKKYKR